MLNLIPHKWYWSKSLSHDVKFVEICNIQGKDYGKCYVEFPYNDSVGGAYLPVTDLVEI